MMDKPLLIVMTENNWLFAGLSDLLPEMTCLRMDYASQHMPREVKKARNIIVAVDSLIFFRGEWLTYNSLRACREDISVVWLTQEHTGRVFPATSRGDRILSQTEDISSLAQMIREIAEQSVSRIRADRVRPVSLTLTERRLLPFFIAGVSLPDLSRQLGCAIKTLYHHRHSIVTKAGFRQPVFLEYVYKSNPGFSGIFSPESTAWKTIWHEEQKQGLSVDG